MNFIPKKTLMACLAIAISSTAYAQDNLLTRIVGGVANAIITKAGDKIEEHRKERQEKIKKDRQSPEYYAKVGTQTCHKATNIHEKYATKLILAKDNAAYKKTLQSYYQDYADLFMASADKAADKSEVKAIVEIANTVRNETTSYEARKQVTSHQKFQETISNLTQEIQKGCLSSMSVAADETARKYRRDEYKNGRATLGSDHTIRFLVVPDFYDDVERRYTENNVCSKFDEIVVNDSEDTIPKDEHIRFDSPYDMGVVHGIRDYKNEKHKRIIPNLTAFAMLKDNRRAPEYDIDITKICPNVQSKIAKKKERIAELERKRKEYLVNLRREIREIIAKEKKRCAIVEKGRWEPYTLEYLELSNEFGYSLDLKKEIASLGFGKCNTVYNMRIVE